LGEKSDPSGMVSLTNPARSHTPGGVFVAVGKGVFEGWGVSLGASVFVIVGLGVSSLFAISVAAIWVVRAATV